MAYILNDVESFA